MTTSEAQKRAIRKYRNTHRESLRKKNTEYMQRWRNMNKESWNAYMRAYYLRKKAEDGIFEVEIEA